jgi:uncharacterized protein (DUF1697 family)
MPRFVILLRGVNVGKGNRVPMADFRSLLETQGFTDISTLLNSGNAVCAHKGRSVDQHAATIRTALEATLGVNVTVVVKSATQFAAAVAENSLAPDEAEHSRFLVAFAQEPQALQALSALQPLLQKGERFLIGSQAAYLHCSGGILESKAATALLGKLGRSVTTRNWATVLKLQALLRGNGI